MYNDIMDAVTRRLDVLFGEETAIYTDGVEQGLQKPCFFVGFLEPSERQIIGQRYYRDTGVYIQYIPEETGQKRRTLNLVSDILMDGMEYITLEDGSLLRGTARKVKVSEGVLSFFVNYNMFVWKGSLKEEEMGQAEFKTEIKKG